MYAVHVPTRDRAQRPHPDSRGRRAGYLDGSPFVRAYLRVVLSLVAYTVIATQLHRLVRSDVAGTVMWPEGVTYTPPHETFDGFYLDAGPLESMSFFERLVTVFEAQFTWPPIVAVLVVLGISTLVVRRYAHRSRN